MNHYSDIEILKQYIDRTKEILELSSPQLTGVENGEEYRRLLLRSFTKIGELAKENNRILNKHFYPLIQSTSRLTSEDILTMRDFTSSLMDATSMENIDLPLIYMQTERMLREANARGDLRDIILALDSMVIASYMMFNLTYRLYPEFSYCFNYRDSGFDAAMKLLEYLPPEKFVLLPDDECKELVLINSRYVRCMFEWENKEDRSYWNENDLKLMRRALSLADDPFYRNEMPNYSWDVHVFRTLQYLADFTEDHNKHGFNREQLEEIYSYTKEMVSFLQGHEELAKGCPQVEQELYLLRNSYLAGHKSKEVYKHELCDLMSLKDPTDITARGMFINFTIPYEYILTLDKDHLSAEEAEMLRTIYKDIARYAYRLPKTGVLSFMLTFLSDVLRHFIEVPGGMDFETLCLDLIAVMHPPSYVHTLSVSNFCSFLTTRLLEKDPEKFVGILDTKSVEDVLQKKQEIVQFSYHGALLHDIGKLFIVETIITYGRDLPEEEFELIRTHPEIGASLLNQFPDTAPYAEFARGHHKWFDNSAGYPNGFDMLHAKNRTLVSILTVADCLDAATDAVGRSYKDGKSLDDVIAELKEASGTRYAPYLTSILNDDDVYPGLQKLLQEGRDGNYRKAFSVLKEL
ncbi:MAG: HD domain-containing protein [Lachnospiraceae bacterium]|nr:HD domain-containing protein [Lachnospiraceae bacterium]